MYLDRLMSEGKALRSLYERSSTVIVADWVRRR
jgi:hypothetical protein